MNDERYQVLPPLSDAEYQRLKSDIRENGVLVPVEIDEYGEPIDGHHRIRACRELGINNYPTIVRAGLSEEQKRALARKLNVLRRQLNREQVRQAVAEQLKETPQYANNRIAGEIGVDSKTVESVRGELEATSEIPKLDRLIGADGKERPRNVPHGAFTPPGSSPASRWTDDQLAEWRKSLTPGQKVDIPKNEFVSPELRAAKCQLAVALIQQGAHWTDPQVQELMIPDLGSQKQSMVICGNPNGMIHGPDPFGDLPEADVREWQRYYHFLIAHLGNATEQQDKLTWLRRHGATTVEAMMREGGFRVYPCTIKRGEDGEYVTERISDTPTFEIKFDEKYVDAWRKFSGQHEDKSSDELCAAIENEIEEQEYRRKRDEWESSKPRKRKRRPATIDHEPGPAAG